MRAAANPGPLRRALRSRLTAASTGLLALSLLASAGTGTAASAQLQGLLDDNWRGLYDLLVTAPGTEAELAGLMSPSSLGALETRMTMDDLATVAAVEGVEVAAPLGSVTVDAGQGRTQLFISAPITPGDTVEDRRGYRLTFTYTVDDGLGERIVDVSQVGVEFDDADLPTAEPMTAEEVTELGDVTCFSDGVAYTEPSPEAPDCFMKHLRSPMEVIGPANRGGSGFERSDGQVVAHAGAAPDVPPTILLLDPTAEQALLGEAGAFLQPLSDIAGTEQSFVSLAEHLESEPSARAAAIRGQAAQFQAALDEVTGPDDEVISEYVPTWGTLPVVPVLTAPSAQGTLQLTVRVESGFDPPPESEARSLPREVFGDEPGVLLREDAYDASALLDPFSTETLVIPLLTDEAPDISADELEPFPGIIPSASATTAALPFALHAEGISITADEYLAPSLDWDRGRGLGVFEPGTDGTGLGSEAMYRSIVEQFSGDATILGEMPGFVPIADYDASAIGVDDSSLGYAPLGSFDTIETTLVADAAGSPVDPVEITPPVTGFGITNPMPTTVADISQAHLLQLDDPISSIRVRVAGVEGGYTQRNIQRVTEVGQRLVDAGFTVTMAAGSSRESVPIQVDGWAFGLSPEAFETGETEQTVGALGTVEQRWPSIGAAQRVEAAVVTSTIAVLALAIAATTLLFGVVQIAGIGPRRRDATLLARFGWRRSRIARRFAAEDAVSLGVLAAAGAGAITLMATQTIGSVDAATPWIVGAALGVAVLVACAALIASVPKVQTAPARPRRLASDGPAASAPRALARSTVGFGIGQARLHLGHAVTVLTALMIIGLATAGAFTVVQQGIAAAGQTELADASSAQALVVQALLAAICIVSGVVLVVLARRLDARLRAGQWRALHAMGWSARRIWIARAIELVTVGVPAIALAAVISWFAAPFAGAPTPLPIALVAAGAAALALALLLALQRTDRPAAGTASRKARS